jgi:ABC-type multidrug transport system ATPase subunit
MCLACAFVGNPDVIILDEPTLGLDLRFKRIFYNKIR